jgi:Coenzyme PQQ synthesis protein D (PqqD)
MPKAWPQGEGEQQPMTRESINQDLGNGVPQVQRVGGGMHAPAKPCAGGPSCPQRRIDPHRPKRRSDVSVRRIEGERVVLDRRAGLIHQLNHTASYIWDRCDGQLTVAEIAAQLAMTFDVDARTAARDVVTLISQFQSVGVLEACGCDDGCGRSLLEARELAPRTMDVPREEQGRNGRGLV